MGRFRESTTEDSDEAGIDISPLIDCVFILLIFFIVTTVFVEESGVEVDKPQAAAASQSDEEKTSVMLEITPKGEIVYEGSSIGFGGIKSAVRKASQKEDVPVIIKADPSARSGVLVRVIDEANQAGAKKVSLAAIKPNE